VGAKTLTAHRGFLHNYLVGLAIEDMAGIIPVNANSEHPLTQEQIQRLLEGLGTLPPRRPSRDSLEWERYHGLSAVQYVQIVVSQGQTPFSQSAFFRYLSARKSLVNWNIIYRRMNEWYDAMLEPSLRERAWAILEPMDSAYQMKWIVYRRFLTGDATETAIYYLFPLLVPDVGAFEESIRRSECVDNMQHLVLAILLYRLENGTMPDENWATQIKQYLGDNPEQYFSCPSNLHLEGASPKGETTYAFIQYGDTVPENFDTLLLVELKESVPFDKATITADEILAQKRMGGQHSDMINTAYQSGAVQQLSEYTEEKELARLLGRAVAE